MPLRLSGLSSGTDWEAIIQKMMEAARKPLEVQQQRQLALESKRDLWRDVQTRLGNLQSAINTLKLASTFDAKNASSSDEKVLTATAGADAAAGTYSIVVSDVAKAQRVRSNAQTSDTSALGLAAGTITVGKQADGTAATINVTASDTLRSLADKINNTSTTVKASVVKVATNDYRLVLTAANTGADYAFNGTNTGNVVDGTSNALTTLGILGGTDANANTFNDANEVDPAQNASVTIDGLSIQRNSNIINDAITGLTINLVQKAPTQTITLTVSNDNTTALDAAKAFVDQYNSAYDFIKGKMSTQVGTNKPGPLQGDPLAATILSRLRTLANGTVSSISGKLDSLSQVGITTGKFGTADQDKLLLDSTVFADKLTKNLKEVKELFGAQAVNVALNSNGATATASSTAAGYSASDVINGDASSTSWGAPGGGWMDNTAGTFPDTLDITFSAARTINQVVIYTIDSATLPASTNGIKDFDLQYWQGGAWQTLKSVTGNTSGKITLDFDAVSTDKIRIQINASNDASQSRLVEVAAYQKNDGVAVRLNDYLNSLLTGNGSIPSTRSSLDKEVTRVKERINTMEQRLAQQEDQLYQKFARTEQTLSTLRAQQSRLQAIFGNVKLF